MGIFITACLVLLELLAVRTQEIPAPFELRSTQQVQDTTPSDDNVQRTLGPKLSKGAIIYFPNSVGYQNRSARWSLSAKSDFAVVVVPALDKDVSETVKFANAHNVPFIAVNKGHGTASLLSTAKHGISIYIRAFDSIKIAKDGNSAKMGGGTYVDQSIRAFAAKGKASASGSCGCVGMLGPGLGGGFGRYQGYFGLVTDNIIDMTVVLADGSITTVSPTVKPDLFWAMRGAGHNFGIVTSYNFKIHDAPVTHWYIETMVFTQDKLEHFFELSNKIGADGAQDQRLVLYTLFALNPQISATTPVIILVFEFAGTKAEAQPLVTQFQALGPVFSVNDYVPYTEVAHAAQSGVEDPVCQPGGSKKLFPVGLLTYNVTTNRAAFNLFSKMLTEHPEFNNSIIQFEAYPLQGVKAVNPASTAYPHREDNLLVSFGTFYPDPSLDAVALSYGTQARALFHAGDAPGRPLNAYVNYASSNETPEQLYGSSLQRLRRLKREYDPHNRFAFYGSLH